MPRRASRSGWLTLLALACGGRVTDGALPQPDGAGGAPAVSDASSDAPPATDAWSGPADAPAFVTDAGAAFSVPAAECLARPDGCLEKDPDQTVHGMLFHQIVDPVLCSWAGNAGCSVLIFSFDDHGCVVEIKPGSHAGWSAAFLACVHERIGKRRWSCASGATEGLATGGSCTK